MIQLGVSGGPEVREAGYTDLVVKALSAVASGEAGDANLAWLRSSVSEVAAGWWSRALALASVDPAGIRTAGISPDMLATIGRRLARSGEVVYRLDASAGSLRFVEASEWDIYGAGDRASWSYDLTETGPTETATRRRVPAAGVLHVRYGWRRRQPWIGLSPADFAYSGAGLVGGLDNMLASEALAPSGYVLEVPDVGDAPDDDDDDNPDQHAALRRDIGQLRGRTALSPSMMAGHGAGAAAAPRQVAPYRIGANPPNVLALLSSEGGARMVAAFGLHPSLFYPNSNGQTLREAWRTFVALTATALADLIAQELSDAAGVRVSLDLARAKSADVVMLSRAVHSLTSAGMAVDDARELVGI